MNKIIILAILFIGVVSCKKKSENPEDYINFLINNEFRFNHYKNNIKNVEWNRDGLQKGVLDFNIVKETKVKFFIKNREKEKMELYYTAMSGLVNTYIGEVDLHELSNTWKQNKAKTGIILFSSGVEYNIDLDKDEIVRNSKKKNITEKLEKIKS